MLSSPIPKPWVAVAARGNYRVVELWRGIRWVRWQFVVDSRQFIAGSMADVFLLQRENECVLDWLCCFIRDGMFKAELDVCRLGSKSLEKVPRNRQG